MKSEKVIIFDNLVQSHPAIIGKFVPVKAIMPDNMSISALEETGVRARKAAANFIKRFKGVE